MPRTHLTDARVRAFKPRKTAYDIRDGKLRGFGLRVLPSGAKRFFVHCQHRGERVWKIIGDDDAMDVSEARSRAVTVLAAVRLGENPPPDPAETLFEAVAETVFERRSRVWKAGTLAVNRAYLRSQILPHFAGRQIADIDSRDVANWFASLRATPVAADRSMPVLSVIMREAEAMGFRPEGSNPCKGIRRYRREGRERFLSDDEIRRLSAALTAHEGLHPEQVAVVRLLLLTGCRKGEILTLRWSDYREGRLFPPRFEDGSPNRLAVRAGQEHSRRPGAKGPLGVSRVPDGRPSEQGPLGSVLVDAPRRGGTGRTFVSTTSAHTHASIALREGETVLAIGRLLGHANPETTLKYTHLSDVMTMEAAETVGAVLEGN